MGDGRKMDVQYRPKDWVEMKDGLDQITKDTFVKLFDANRLLADTQGKIQDLDEDRSINFHYKDQTEIIAKLREAYTTLGKFCDEAGQAVYDAIDKPFFVQMDQFAQKMRDVSIKNFETTNRIGFTTITTVQGSSGYGETAQTIKTTKNTITVDDIFKESYAFDEVLRADYEERKRQDPTLKLDYEEYRKHIPSTRGFEYLSIEDDQKKLETWRDFGIGVITIGGLFICPPLGIAAGTVFGILEVKSAYDGEDWETHRKLDKEERVVRGVFGGLDAMSGAGSLMKSAKGIGTLVKLPGDGTNFNPNVGKNMVQSLRDNNTLKNTLIPVGVSWMDTAGIGIKMPVVRFSKVGEIGEDFTKARVIAKDDPYQHIKGSGGSGVSSEGSVVKGTGKIDYDELKVRLKERYKRFVDDKRQNIPQTSTELLPNELNHGKFGRLPNVKGDDITGHHMPSNKYMQEEFEIKTKDSYAMFLEHPHPGQGGRHRRTFTYGLSQRTRSEDFNLYMSLKPRDSLAFDINDLRRIMKEDGLYNKENKEKLKEYIDYYKKYEHNDLKIFDKPK
mgnify:CR=1 FL=1